MEGGAEVGPVEGAAGSGTAGVMSSSFSPSSELTIGVFESGASGSGASPPAGAIAEPAPGTGAAGTRVIAAAIVKGGSERGAGARVAECQRWTSISDFSNKTRKLACWFSGCWAVPRPAGTVRKKCRTTAVPSARQSPKPALCFQTSVGTKSPKLRSGFQPELRVPRDALAPTHLHVRNFARLFRGRRCGVRGACKRPT